MPTPKKTFAIYYEHPDWFRPLFAELERRDIPFVRLGARCHSYDVSARQEASDYALAFNRMSPSAYLRGGGNSLFYTLNYLAHLERLGLRVINGHQAFTYETSKALQLELLESLGLDYPRTRVINHPSLAPTAAEGLRFPVVVKANVGGSGAGITRYETPDALAQAAAEGSIELGLDSVALVQEFTPARDGHITRIETLGGKFLYGINVYTNGDSFNLCPADICRTSSGVQLERSACPADAPQTGLTVEGYTPPPAVIEAVERIAQAAKIDVGGIEYMVDDRDGRLVYYDVNALSNFVADARNVIGFDPHERLVDFLVREAQP
jgi:glutathione synthase/RimK-type ligase-like ATP-grasp enzyme